MGSDRPGFQDERKGWIMSVKLTDAQLVMMSAAAQREDRCLAAPERLKGAAVSKVSAKLVKLGLAREIRAKAGTPIWSRGEEGQAYALKLTATGLKAIAVDEGSEEALEPGETAQPQPLSEAKTSGSPDDVGRRTHAVAPREGSKLALVINLLRRADGAGIVDLTEATGWLSHTTRAALTGLRKRGYAVVRERVGASLEPPLPFSHEQGAGLQTDALSRLRRAPAERSGGIIVLLGAKNPLDRFVETAKSVRLEPIGQHPHQQPAGEMDGRLAAQMSAPMAAQSVEIAALEIGHDRQNTAVERQRSV